MAAMAKAAIHAPVSRIMEGLDAPLMLCSSLTKYRSPMHTINSRYSQTAGKPALSDGHSIAYSFSGSFLRRGILAPISAFSFWPRLHIVQNKAALSFNYPVPQGDLSNV